MLRLKNKYTNPALGFLVAVAFALSSIPTPALADTGGGGGGGGHHDHSHDHSHSSSHDQAHGIDHSHAHSLSHQPAGGHHSPSYQAPAYAPPPKDDKKKSKPVKTPYPNHGYPFYGYVNEYSLTPGKRFLYRIAFIPKGIFIGIRRLIGAFISFFGGWLHGQNYWLGGHVYKLQDAGDFFLDLGKQVAGPGPYGPKSPFKK